mmetsp:Transcript_5445/g.9198  ORF Transcript_5445/g.9198 Transcript_5445/m.9198 type:complete len:135 (-) Transcript_5445:73-477(-)
MESDAFVTASLAFVLASCVAWVVKSVSFDTKISFAATAVEEEDSDDDDILLFAVSTCSIADECDDDFLVENCRLCGGRSTIIRQQLRIIIFEALLAPSAAIVIIISNSYCRVFTYAKKDWGFAYNNALYDLLRF